MRLYTAAQTRQLDQGAQQQLGCSAVELMQRAAQQAFEAILARRPQARRWLVLCGRGHNGGDGYALARLVLHYGGALCVVCLDAPQGRAPQAMFDAFVQAGGRVTSNIDGLRATYDVVVDAVFGTGLNRPPGPAAARLLDCANRCRGYKVALDVPSGLDSDSGVAYTPCFGADLSVSFVGRKLGMYSGEAASVCGERLFYDLGIGPGAAAAAYTATLLEPPRLAARPANSHKGDFGRVLIVGGSAGMLGAALLTGKAALRAGSGLVTLLTHPARLDWPALHCPELMSVCLEPDEKWQRTCQQADVFVLGPGWEAVSPDLFDQLVAYAKPMVVDAGALRYLQAHARYSPNWILTPHPGEAAGLLDCSVAALQQQRVAACRDIAARYGGVCVLKGRGTLIGEADGGVTLCPWGNAGLASAGTGDVLSGILAAFCGQGLSLRAATEAGVWLHATSADAVAARLGQPGLLASDVVEQLPYQVLAASGC